MGIRSGTASLPLHDGRVPRWLAERMALLGAAVAEAVILEEGQLGFLRRLSDPFWFQAFGAVLGMDWHSSGITTSVLGALKRGLAPRAAALGVHFCGGRGRHSRKTPAELLDLAHRVGLDGDRLVRASRLVAKVDSVALQDGFSLYLHSFVVTDRGDWVVVQQGMNGERRQARRYHWRSEAVKSFVEEPHDAIVGPNQGRIVNLTDRRACGARDAAVELAVRPPESVVREVARVAAERHAQMPAHHEVRPTDVFLRRLHAVITLSRERSVEGFEELLLVEGLGPRTMQALALVAEVAYGAPSRFDDPARFAFAHGGKDGHPFPVPLRVYDGTIETLRRALERARVGRSDKIRAFRRLEASVVAIERGVVDGPSLGDIVEGERNRSPSLGGRTVAGHVPPESERHDRGRATMTPAVDRVTPRKRQLELFG